MCVYEDRQMCVYEDTAVAGRAGATAAGELELQCACMLCGPFS